MNKLVYCAAVLLITNVTVHADTTREEKLKITQEKLEKDMTGFLTATFSSDNMYEKALKLDDWNKVLARTEMFVTQYSAQNKELLYDYKLIKQINDEVVE